jgi:hypothetical protein
MSRAIPPLPNTPSWLGDQSTGTTLPLPLPLPLPYPSDIISSTSQSGVRLTLFNFNICAMNLGDVIMKPRKE